jgi:hypothetical protein
MSLAGLQVFGVAEANCRRPVPVHFPSGSSAANLTGAVPRADRDCYTFVARSGQHLQLSQQPGPDDNIVFQVYRPVWKIDPQPVGFEFHGLALPGASDTDDTAKWSGVLPTSGAYLLVVGTTAGGGEYHINIAIH